MFPPADRAGRRRDLSFSAPAEPPMPSSSRRPSPLRPRLFLLPILAALLTLAPALRAAAAIDDHDLWYVIEMDGKKAGWMHTSQTTQDGRITNTGDTRISLKRGR